MSVIEIVLIVLVIAVLALQVVHLLRGREDAGLTARLDALKDDNRHLREALAQEQRAGRGEVTQSLEQFRSLVQEQLGGMSAQQHERIGHFGQRLDVLTERTGTGLEALQLRLTEDARRSREELTLALNRFGEQQQQRLAALTADNEKRLNEVRATLETKLKAIQDDNAAKLEQMRATVDEKLQNTLETRLGQSFALVSERLEQVQRGLGEMQNLAIGVGDLKRVLTNDQYDSNVVTVPGSNDRVEFAVRMPGAGEHAQLYLPIDAKFPVEDYQRLLDAQEAADADAAALAGRALEVRVREEAKRFRSKYVAPPHTTDFAVLFLPTEGLYAEVIRRPGLFESLQRDHHVTVAGPTTLTALLNSLQMGFRTLAIAQRSSEVWTLLGAVKTEFGKFGAVLDKTRKKLNEASNVIDQASVRTRAIERKLRGVETLNGDEAQQLLIDAPAIDELGDDDTEV